MRICPLGGHWGGLYRFQPDVQLHIHIEKSTMASSRRGSRCRSPQLTASPPWGLRDAVFQSEEARWTAQRSSRCWAPCRRAGSWPCRRIPVAVPLNTRAAEIQSLPALSTACHLLISTQPGITQSATRASLIIQPYVSPDVTRKLLPQHWLRRKPEVPGSKTPERPSVLVRDPFSLLPKFIQSKRQTDSNLRDLLLAYPTCAYTTRASSELRYVYVHVSRSWSYDYMQP